MLIARPPSPLLGCFDRYDNYLLPPRLQLNALPAASHAPLGIFDAAAISVWVAGMALEVSADRTKAQWRQERQDGQHKEKFLERGVWAWCRHPKCVIRLGAQSRAEAGRQAGRRLIICAP